MDFEAAVGCLVSRCDGSDDAENALAVLRQRVEELERVVAGEEKWHLASRCPAEAEVRRLEGLIVAFCSATDIDPFFSAMSALRCETRRIRQREAR